MKEIDNILNVLNVEASTIVFDNISYYQLILAAINSGQDMYKELGYKTRKNFSRRMAKAFPEKEGASYWFNYLLSLCEYRRCSKCQKVHKEYNFRKRGSSFKSHCKLCGKDADKEYRKNNTEKIHNAKKLYYAHNRDNILLKGKLYHKENPEIRRSSTRKRQANKLKATPKWYEQALITELYKQSSKETHIDHIIPLKNNIVCGLHCIDNLQAISAKENLEKSNKLNTIYVEDLIMCNLALNGLASYEFMEDY